MKKNAKKGAKEGIFPLFTDTTHTHTHTYTRTHHKRI